jgi:CMP-N,N'-diacetyllegionaminic acid synthase
VKVIAIIPARGNSKRLAKKNIYPVWNMPMIYWSIKACKESKFSIETWVSTECDKIKNVCKAYDVKIHNRSPELSGDFIFKQAVIRNAASEIVEKYKNRKEQIIFISLQANSPDIKSHHLDGAIEALISYNRSEIISVDQNLMQNAAFRVFRGDYVFQKDLSTNCGVYVCDIHDVHTIEDIKLLEAKNNA